LRENALRDHPVRDIPRSRLRWVACDKVCSKYLHGSGAKKGIHVFLCPTPNTFYQIFGKNLRWHRHHQRMKEISKRIYYHNKLTAPFFKTAKIRFKTSSYVSVHFKRFINPGY
ncbi:MAG: hypothetical protein V1743_03690, partial [Nanoarchaeota archaeon]